MNKDFSFEIIVSYFCTVFSFSEGKHIFWIRLTEGVCSSQSQSFALPPVRVLAPSPGPQFVFTVLWPVFVFAGPGPQFVFTNPGYQIISTSPSPQFVFTGIGPKFVYTSLGLQFYYQSGLRVLHIPTLPPQFVFVFTALVYGLHYRCIKIMNIKNN